MDSETRTIYLQRSNKGVSSKFTESYLDQKVTKEGQGSTM